MAVKNVFDQLRPKPGDTQSALGWYLGKVKDLVGTNYRAERLFIDYASNQQGYFYSGQMVMFNYNPKYKNELPYYDKYPLVVPWDQTSDGFIGLNLHYLSPVLRLRLLEKLYKTTTNDKMNASTRFRINWSIIGGSAKYKEVAPCVKRYLFGQMKSKFLYIDPNDWPSAVALPTERFVGASRESVFRKSRRMF
jgi:hypothetical protein